MESDIEWVQITVVGTSFVLNQIRKMVGAWWIRTLFAYKTSFTNTFTSQPALLQYLEMAKSQKLLIQLFKMSSTQHYMSPLERAFTSMKYD